MKNLLVFAVAAISATYPNLAKAQKSVVSVSIGNTEKVIKPVKFIDAIQFKRDLTKTTSEDVVPLVDESKGKKEVTISKTEETKSTAAKIESCTALQFKFAQLLNMDVEEVADLKTLEFIQDWWGTRYRYGGTSRSGIDCSSFTGKLYAQVYGITTPRTAREQYKVTNRVKRDELQEGDFVFFNTRGGISHVGVYIANGYFAHSSTSSGVTVSSLNDSYYSGRFIGGGRYSEQTEQ